MDGGSVGESSDGSSWDPPKQDLFNTAILYDSFRDPVKCGHTIALDRWIDFVQGSPSARIACPICGAAVLYVEDGMVSKKESNSFVTLKYGKLIYRLSVPTSGSSTKLANDEAASLFWLSLRNLFSANPFQPIRRQETVQDRIAAVLGFKSNFGMKVGLFIRTSSSSLLLRRL